MTHPPDIPLPLLLASEAELQRYVQSQLDRHGWLWFHDTDPRRNRAGLPDLIATDGRTLVLAELKSQDGRLRPRQAIWMEQLATVEHLVTEVWRPSNRDTIDALLSRR